MINYIRHTIFKRSAYGPYFDKKFFNSRIGVFLFLSMRASILYVATKRYRFGPTRGSQGELAAPLTHAFAPSIFIKNSRVR